MLVPQRIDIISCQLILCIKRKLDSRRKYTAITPDMHETYACIPILMLNWIFSYWNNVGDSNGGFVSMRTYFLFYISMSLGTFVCIVSFHLVHTGTDNI